MNEIGNKLLSNLGTDPVSFMSALHEAWPAFADFLADVAIDIYDSCIKCYYEDYTPKRYKRHGDITGFNLYRANQIKYEKLTRDISLLLDEDYLLDYGDLFTKEEVFDQIFVNGKRGMGFERIEGHKKNKVLKKWPVAWIAKYPNRNSKYDWKSDKNTIDAIFDDFCNTAVQYYSKVLYDETIKCLR